MTKNIAELMVDVLAGAAVERVYGLSGDSLNGFTDAICKQEQIRWIHVRHKKPVNPKLSSSTAALARRPTGTRPIIRLTLCLQSICGTTSLLRRKDLPAELVIKAYCA
jgi:hypothetical protein